MRKILERLSKTIWLVLTCIVWIVSITYMVITIHEDSFFRSNSFLMLVRLAVIGIIIFVVIFTWQKYNYHKFGKLDRRKFPQPVTVDDMGEIFAVTGEIVEELRGAAGLSLELVSEYDSKNNSIIDRLMMRTDTSEYEICLPYTAVTAMGTTADALLEHEDTMTEK